MTQRHLLVNNYAKTIFYHHHRSSKKVIYKRDESFFTLVTVDASFIWSCSSSNIYPFLLLPNNLRSVLIVCRSLPRPPWLIGSLEITEIIKIQTALDLSKLKSVDYQNSKSTLLFYVSKNVMKAPHCWETFIAFFEALSLHKECLCLEFFLAIIFPHSYWIRRFAK